MDLRDTARQGAFREEARAWLEENLPPDWRDWTIPEASVERLEERAEWERRLAGEGWIGIYWPKEYGGRGATLSEQIIFIEEYAKVGAPPRLSFFGEGLLGPTLLVFGSEQQKRRFLPGITGAREYWCQGYSEPNAGSDLAAQQTKAVRDGDEWVITGQKIWTTMGHRADYMFLLARTDAGAPKHKGISYLLMPMRQQGVEVRPIKQMTGSSEFNEVFLDGARTQSSWLVGAPNQGWMVALATLGFERSTAALSQTILFEKQLARLIQRLRTIQVDGGPLSDHPAVRQHVMRLYGRLRVMRFNNYRLVTELLSTGGVPGPQSSLSKVVWSEWHRDFARSAVDLLGPYGMLLGDDWSPDEGEWERAFLESRAETVYAGTSEIQRNVIGEMVLGLPKEPRVVATPGLEEPIPAQQRKSA
ncbi:MAG: acyl-CoA dehydrogenase family protein [Actinomycetota bacterium]|nr:acyl-CoA dehydrogenase family protein [Actinomycetota bacterium]